MKFLESKLNNNRDLLVTKLADFLRENKIENLDLGKSLAKNSLFGKLTVYLFDEYDYKKALNLKSIWTRNQDSIKTDVKECLIKNSEKNLNTIEKFFSLDEWLKLKSNIISTKTKRLKFNAKFTSILNEILKIYKINCSVISENNYFTPSLNVESCWKGIFKFFSIVLNIIT